MYKLLMRAFPGWYRPNNIYALYPFNTPDRTKEVFAKRGVPHQIPLDYSVPQSLPQPIPVMSYQDVASVLADQKNFNVTCKFGNAAVYQWRIRADDRDHKGAHTFLSLQVTTSCSQATRHPTLHKGTPTSKQSTNPRTSSPMCASTTKILPRGSFEKTSAS